MMALIFSASFSKTSHNTFYTLCISEPFLLVYECVSVSVTISLGIKHARSLSSLLRSPSYYATSCNARQEQNLFFCSVPALSTSELLRVYIIFIYSKKEVKEVVYCYMSAKVEVEENIFIAVL